MALSLRPGFTLDYTSRLIYPYCNRPLLSDFSTCGLIAPLPYFKQAPTSKDHVLWHFDALTWSDSLASYGHTSQLISSYLCSLGQAETERPNSWVAREALDTNRPSEVTSRELVIRAKRPLPRFAKILTHESFSPVAANFSLPQLYELAGCLRGNRGYLLRRTDQCAPEQVNLPERLVFLRTDSVQLGLSLFEIRKLDVTCPTRLGLDCSDRVLGSPYLDSQEQRLAVGILASPVTFAALPSLMMALSKATKRLEIAMKFGNLVRPIFGWRDLWTAVQVNDLFNPNAACEDLAACKVRHTIRIAYADFEPNGEILAELLNCWKSVLGLDIQAQALPFSKFVSTCGSAEFDLYYILTPAMFDDPAGLYWYYLRPGGFAAGMDVVSLEALQREIRNADECMPNEFDSTYKAIDNSILNGSAYVPLFGVNGNYLRKNSSTRYSSLGRLSIFS
jgi:hypothetical protein